MANLKWVLVVVFLTSILLISVEEDTGIAGAMDDLIHQFGENYESLKPEKNSSVHTDYKLEQAALGTYYTTQALNLIYDQNQTLLSKYDRMIEKYDQIVEQNKEIIRLLTIISQKDTSLVSQDPTTSPKKESGE